MGRAASGGQVGRAESMESRGGQGGKQCQPTMYNFVCWASSCIMVMQEVNRGSWLKDICNIFAIFW